MLRGGAPAHPRRTGPSPRAAAEAATQAAPSRPPTALGQALLDNAVGSRCQILPLALPHDAYRRRRAETGALPAGLVVKNWLEQAQPRFAAHAGAGIIVITSHAASTISSWNEFSSWTSFVSIVTVPPARHRSLALTTRFIDLLQLTAIPAPATDQKARRDTWTIAVSRASIAVMSLMSPFTSSGVECSACAAECKVLLRDPDAWRTARISPDRRCRSASPS